MLLIAALRGLEVITDLRVVAAILTLFMIAMRCDSLPPMTPPCDDS